MGKLAQPVRKARTQRGGGSARPQHYCTLGLKAGTSAERHILHTCRENQINYSTGRDAVAAYKRLRALETVERSTIVAAILSGELYWSKPRKPRPDRAKLPTLGYLWPRTQRGAPKWKRDFGTLQRARGRLRARERGWSLPAKPQPLFLFPRRGAPIIAA
jgi:hypothetical protein